jgi:hypothetical protein
LNFINLIAQLLPIVTPLVPAAGEVGPLAIAAANIIAYIQQQKNLTTEQILARAGVQLDQNEIELLKDLAQLQGTTGATGSTGTTGASGSSGSTPGGN